MILISGAELNQTLKLDLRSFKATLASCRRVLCFSYDIKAKQDEKEFWLCVVIFPVVAVSCCISKNFTAGGASERGRTEL